MPSMMMWFQHWNDHAQKPVSFTVRTGREIQQPIPEVKVIILIILIIIVVAIEPVGKVQAPQAFNLNWLPVRVLKLSEENPAARIKRVDSAVAKVAHQQCVAGAGEVVRREG